MLFTFFIPVRSHVVCVFNRSLAGITKDAVLILEMNDEDVFKDDHIGTASVPLAQLGPENPAAPYALQNSKGAATGTLQAQIVLFDVRSRPVFLSFLLAFLTHSIRNPSCFCCFAFFC